MEATQSLLCQMKGLSARLRKKSYRRRGRVFSRNGMGPLLTGHQVTADELQRPVDRDGLAGVKFKSLLRMQQLQLLLRRTRLIRTLLKVETLRWSQPRDPQRTRSILILPQLGVSQRTKTRVRARRQNGKRRKTLTQLAPNSATMYLVSGSLTIISNFAFL